MKRLFGIKNNERIFDKEAIEGYTKFEIMDYLYYMIPWELFKQCIVENLYRRKELEILRDKNYKDASTNRY